MKPRLSNWREESNLFEVVTGKMTDKEALKKVSEKKGIQNKVIINPKLSEALKDMGGELLEIAEIDKEGDKEDPKQAQIASKQKRAAMIKKQVLMKKLQAVRAGSEDIVAHYEPEGEVIEGKLTSIKATTYGMPHKERQALIDKEREKIKKAKKVKEDFEDVVEYFYAEGINEEGIDLIIEEVGLDDFVDFVDDSAELLTEERAARKMNVRTLKATQKKAAEIKASKKDVVKRGTPADTLARARTERLFKKPKLAKPAPKKEAPKPVAKKPAPKPAPKPVAKKDYDGDGKKETPKQEHRGVRNKKITQAVKKVKPTQPKKPASKEGIRAKIKSAYEAGVKRHKKAVQPARVFAKGMKAGAKKTVKFAKDVKKAVVGEELSNWRDELVLEGKCDDCSCKGCGQNPCVECGEDHHKLDEAKADTGTAAEKASARNKRNTPPGKDSKFDTSVFITRKPGESLDSARTRKRREAHAKKRGVKENFSNWRNELQEKDLSAAERRALPNKDFALPGKGEGPQGKQAGSYPIPDEKHARSALSLVSQHGTPEEKAKVRAKVKKKFPGIKVTEDKALEIVRANIIKKHGKGAIYDPKNPPKAQPRPKAKPDTRTPEQKKKDQDHANVMAVYGGEANYKAGRGLGT